MTGEAFSAPTEPKPLPPQTSAPASGVTKGMTCPNKAEHLEVGERFQFNVVKASEDEALTIELADGSRAPLHWQPPPDVARPPIPTWYLSGVPLRYSDSGVRGDCGGDLIKGVAVSCPSWQ